MPTYICRKTCFTEETESELNNARAAETQHAQQLSSVQRELTAEKANANALITVKVRISGRSLTNFKLQYLEI